MEENHKHKISDMQFGDAEAEFTCPNCGKISRDDVVFLCNTCSQADMIYQNGMYMCPTCLTPGDNFECMICESKEVKMELVNKSKK